MADIAASVLAKLKNKAKASGIGKPLNKSLSFRSQTIYVPIFALDKGYLDEKAIIPRIFNHYFLKRADYPYIRLWEVFARQSQANIDWHRRTWHTSDSHSSSTRDIPFSCSQTDTTLPSFVWCISGSRALSAFLVELGALIMVASTIVPPFIMCPVATITRLIASKNSLFRPFSSSR